MKKTLRLFMPVILAVLCLCMCTPAGAAPRLSKKKAELAVGEKITLTVKNRGKEKVKWSSSKKKTATVSKKGKVTAKRPGTAVITAKVGKKKLKCRIIVRKKENLYGTGGQDAPAPKAEPETEAPKPSLLPVSGEEAYVSGKIMNMKNRYPEGMKWTNETYYAWKGGVFRGGYGCAAFAFMLSDEAFGNKKARLSKDIAGIRVGDVLRTDGCAHVVIVIGKYTDGGLAVAEGNYNRQIKWGRLIPKEELGTVDFVITRW